MDTVDAQVSGFVVFTNSRHWSVDILADHATRAKN